MKSIALLSVQENPIVNNRETPVDLKTLDLVKLAVNQAPEGGYTPEEMTKRIRILDVIDSLPENAEALELEDADFDNLKKWVVQVKWSFVSRFIIAFTAQFK